MPFVAIGVGPTSITILVGLADLHGKQTLTGAAFENSWQLLTHEGNDLYKNRKMTCRQNS